MIRVALATATGIGALVFSALALADPIGPISPNAIPKPVHVSWHPSICDNSPPPGLLVGVAVPVGLCNGPQHGVLTTPRVKIRLRFLRALEGEAVAGSTFAAVIGYWSGAAPELTSRLRLNGPGFCRASIIRASNGRLLGSLGSGELSTDTSIFVRETPDGPRIPAMSWSWRIPEEVAGHSTIDNAFVVHCSSLKLTLEPLSSDPTAPRIVSARTVYPNFVRWFHIYRTAP